MGFCPNCGKKNDNVSPLCSCMQGGYCVKCGSQISGGRIKCETCSNAYAFIVSCECFVDSLTVKCVKCDTDLTPYTREEYEDHYRHIDLEQEKAVIRSRALEQKRALMRRLTNNIGGGHCKCSGGHTCHECYVPW